MNARERLALHVTQHRQQSQEQEAQKAARKATNARLRDERYAQLEAELRGLEASGVTVAGEEGPVPLRFEYHPMGRNLSVRVGAARQGEIITVFAETSGYACKVFRSGKPTIESFCKTALEALEYVCERLAPYVVEMELPALEV